MRYQRMHSEIKIAQPSLWESGYLWDRKDPNDPEMSFSNCLRTAEPFDLLEVKLCSLDIRFLPMAWWNLVAGECEVTSSVFEHLFAAQKIAATPTIHIYVHHRRRLMVLAAEVELYCS